MATHDILKPGTKPALVYFNGRGLGESIRVLFAQAGVDYDDRRVEEIDDFKAQLPFGQVPVLILPDGTIIAQSGAIGRYVAKENGLYGSSAKEAALIDMFVDGLNDARNAIYPLPKKTDEEKAKIAKEVLPKWLGYYERILKNNKGGHGFLFGDKLSWADIFFYINLFNWSSTYPGSLDSYPLLVALRDRVASQPKIAAWIEKRPKSDW